MGRASRLVVEPSPLDAWLDNHNARESVSLCGVGAQTSRGRSSLNLNDEARVWSIRVVPNFIDVDRVVVCIAPAERHIAEVHVSVLRP